MSKQFKNKLNAFAEEVHLTAKDKGWWDAQPFNIPEKLALIHSEVSEALEEYRNGNALRIYTNDAGARVEYREGTKPEGMPIELADAIIRILDLCSRMEVDIEYALELKHAYNKTREVRHGGKLA